MGRLLWLLPNFGGDSPGAESDAESDREGEEGHPCDRQQQMAAVEEQGAEVAQLSCGGAEELCR